MTTNSSKHILVVDDDEMMRAFIKELLIINDFNVVEADNGKTGLKEFRNKCPDLIITDIIMPEMEGISFIRELRKSNEDIPIIAMTGNIHGQDDESPDILSQMGANETLQKPIKSNEFLETVNRLI